MWSCFSAIVCYLCSRELRKKAALYERNRHRRRVAQHPAGLARPHHRLLRRPGHRLLPLVRFAHRRHSPQGLHSLGRRHRPFHAPRELQPPTTIPTRAMPCLLRDARSTTSTPMPRLSTAARSLSKTRCRATSWACMSTSFRSTM